MQIEIDQAIVEACMPFFCTALVYMPGDVIPAKRAFFSAGNWSAYRGATYGAREFNDGINWKRHHFIRRCNVQNARRNRLANAFLGSRLP